MNLNPKAIFSLKSKFDTLHDEHTKLISFFKKIRKRAMTEGSTMKISMTTPDGDVFRTSFSLTANDIDLFQTLFSLFGK